MSFFFDPAFFDPAFFDTGQAAAPPDYIVYLTGSINNKPSIVGSINNSLSLTGAINSGLSLVGILGGGMANQNISTFIGEDVTITVTMSPLVDVSAWSFILKVLAPDGTSAISQTTGFTVTGTGVFTCIVASTTTDPLSQGVYQYEIWRTNAGNETVLSYGLWYLRV